MTFVIFTRKTKEIEILVWRCLFLLLTSCLGANTIEYMGIAFECDKGCAVPAYDREARQLIQIFQKVIYEAFDDKWGLVDASGIWRPFDPYQENNDGIEEESCEITRYDWEKSGGILIHDGEGYTYFYEKVTSDWQYVQTHLFHLTHRLSCFLFRSV